jgi:hypothetical protein
MIHVKEPHYFAGFGVFFKRFASARLVPTEVRQRSPVVPPLVT